MRRGGRVDWVGIERGMPTLVSLFCCNQGCHSPSGGQGGCGSIHLMAESPIPGEGVSPEEELKRDVICQGEAEQPLKGPVGNPGITVSISDVCLPGSSGFDWRAGT
ncbi:hypothetical protein DUI87_29697 [Hirundo rustica rustica]|uniref:Uncharacterized protein n=1 Tax=Hirundo rustica rustica TaxID=333673 RepID=A0A3M0JGL1_HIRRU|nr:hypothetical protein DUI87_29697 [Hirundo rustica rustica]